MFMYLINKNDYIESLSGIKKWFERMKFKYEKSNFLKMFMKEDYGISRGVLIDCAEMILSDSIYNDAYDYSINMNFSAGEIIYRAIYVSDGLCMTSIKVIENDKCIMDMRLSHDLEIDSINRPVTARIFNEESGKSYDCVLGEDTNPNELELYINIFKGYIVYLFHTILTGDD